MVRNCELRKIRMNGPYEACTGYYFGVGLPVYEYIFDGLDDTGVQRYEHDYIRAGSRDMAKAKVQSYIVRAFGVQPVFYR